MLYEVPVQCRYRVLHTERHTGLAFDQLQKLIGSSNGSTGLPWMPGRLLRVAASFTLDYYFIILYSFYISEARWVSSSVMRWFYFVGVVILVPFIFLIIILSFNWI